MPEQREPYSGWTIIDLLGHKRLAGFVREEEIAGAGMLRLDVPGPEGVAVATVFINPASLYMMTPTTEPMARAVALRNQPEPVARWELPPASSLCPPAGRDLFDENDTEADERERIDCSQPADDDDEFDDPFDE